MHREELRFHDPAMGMAGRAKVRSHAFRKKRKIMQALQNARGNNCEENIAGDSRVRPAGLSRERTGAAGQTQ
jgi:hypothetical protein